MPGVIPPEFKVVVSNDRIALYPSEKRSDSRLLIVDRRANEIVHIGQFMDIAPFIANDLIVINETRVLPARVFGRRVTGGTVELLFLTTTIEHSVADSNDSSTIAISALISTPRKIIPGMVIFLPDNAQFIIGNRSLSGGWQGIWKSTDGESFLPWLNRVGVPPLPPYIKRPAEATDNERYQTVYAKEPGSIAAPTAGLHFTPELLEQIRESGASIVSLTLDVGWGTFEPVKTTDLSQHLMHAEKFNIPPNTSVEINNAKQQGRPILAVGTTSVRALEAAALENLPIKPGQSEASLFIYPPYQFKVIDRLLTNFHRPDSTLLHLVAALTGWDLLNEAYQRALDEGFRFYSYGDAMLIL